MARWHGMAPNLFYRRRRLMAEGVHGSDGSDEPVVGSSEVRRLEEQISELGRLLGRKAMEVEILKEALSRRWAELAARIAAEGRSPMKTIAYVLGVTRSPLHGVGRQCRAAPYYCRAATINSCG